MVNRDVEFHNLIWQYAQNDYLELALKRVVMPYFAFATIRVSGDVVPGRALRRTNSEPRP